MKVEKNIKRYVISFIIAIIGVFIFISIVSITPENTLFHVSRIDKVGKHIFGYFGFILSSYLYKFFGYSSYLLFLMLSHISYLILSGRKRATIYFHAGLWIIEIVLFSIAISIHRGNVRQSGGEIGLFFIYLFKINKLWKLKVFDLLIFIGILIFLMYRPFIKGFFKWIKGISEKKKEASKKGIRRKENKLPFIKKIYIYPDGELLNSRNDNVFENQAEEEIIEENGQYIIPEVHRRSSENLSVKPVDKVYNIQELNTGFLKKSKKVNKKELERETQKKAKELERTLKEFGIEAKVTQIIKGPVITRYELQPAPGVKLNRIINLSDNIALNLSANGVRIQAPIPGKSAVGIEIPNEVREIVTLGDIIENADYKGELPLILGKDVAGNIVVSDLAEMPHLLIAGATGSGKSVCVNSLILSLLFRKTPEEVRFIMIDPKMVELKIYNGIPHLLTEVVTDPKKAARSLRWVIHEMENRYRLLDELKVRDIKGYNIKSKDKLPYIVVIIDEFANLMAISQKEVEDAVVRLAAMSRAVGIHLIMATQRPSVDVITGLIKANFPYRIAFQVASKTDSRTILDTSGAEKLLGRGDMLFSPAGSMNLIRIQGAYVSDEEVIEVVNELKKNSVVEYKDIFGEEEGENFLDYDEDPMYDEAVEIVLKTRRASASFLQRRLKIGYNRAARLIELMEEKGIIGPPRGSKPREIYIDNV